MAVSDTVKTSLTSRINTKYPYLADVVSTVIPSEFDKVIDTKIIFNLGKWLEANGHVKPNEEGSREEYYEVERATVFLLKEEGFEAMSSAGYKVLVQLQ